MRRYKVRLVGRARTDLAEAKAWLTPPRRGRGAARRYALILEALLDLEIHPLRWPLSDHSGFRERPTQAHRVIYRILDDHDLVEVIRIFSPYQDRSTL